MSRATEYKLLEEFIAPWGKKMLVVRKRNTVQVYCVREDFFGPNTELPQVPPSEQLRTPSSPER